MALTKAQARELRESCGDVFTPNGDAGVIDRLYTFADPSVEGYGKGQHARVIGRNVDAWFPISELESSETLREQREQEQYS